MFVGGFIWFVDSDDIIGRVFVFIFDGGVVEYDAVSLDFRFCGVFGGVVGGVWYRVVVVVELL